MKKKLISFLLFLSLPIPAFADALNYTCSAKAGFWGAVYPEGGRENYVSHLDCKDSQSHLCDQNKQVKILDGYLLYGDFPPVRLINIDANTFYAPHHVVNGERVLNMRAYVLRINDNGTASLDMRIPNDGPIVWEAISFLDCKRQ